MLRYITHAHQSAASAHTWTHKRADDHTRTRPNKFLNSCAYTRASAKKGYRSTHARTPTTCARVEHNNTSVHKLSLPGPALSRKDMTERCTANTESCSCEDDASVKGTDYRALIFHSCMYVVSVHPGNTIKCAWSNERIEISKFCLTTE